jgi:DNA-binding MarR family transcriptional regulator
LSLQVGDVVDKQQLQAFYPLSLAVRRLFHKLADGATALHRDSDISVGMRAVLESVIVGGPQTVPHMARFRPVSRQHIQGLVNQLLAGGYVEYVSNPRHKRSQLVAATPHGCRAFEAMRRKETDAFTRTDIGPTAEELAAATRVLRALATTLDSQAWRSIVAELANKEEKEGHDA